MHWLDRLSLRWLSRQTIFADGWGDIAPLEDASRKFAQPIAAPTLELTWGRPYRLHALTVQDGTAQSCSETLPSTLQTLHVRRLLTSGAPRWRLVVPPSWGDGGYGQRSFLFGALVAQRIEVWLLEGAYFGARLAPLTTVESFFRMGLAHVEEVRALVTTSIGEGIPTAVAGYSMAGQLGSSAVQSLPLDVPVIAMAAPPSADVVFVDGPLRKQVQWPQLGDGGEPKLRALLERFSVLAQPPPKSSRRAVSLNVMDGIVAPEATARIAVHWDVEPTRIRSGHVGAYALERRMLQRIVRDTLR